MKKKLLSLLLAAGMVMSLVACGGGEKAADNKAADDDAIKVCVVYSGNLGDKSYNDSCNIGSTKAQEDFGIVLKTLEGVTADEWKANLLSACEDGYDLVICSSSNFEEYLKEEQLENNKKRIGKTNTSSYLDDPELIKLKEHLSEIEKILNNNPHQIMFGIRPEDIIECDDGIETEVIFAELLGQQYYVHFNYGGKEIISSIFSENMIQNGSKIKLKFKENKYLLFDYLTGVTIY